MAFAESILAITFTRKACQEIKERLLDEALGCKLPVNVFTFHGWAIRFLRMKKVRELAELPTRPVIWTQRDQKEHMAEACQRATVDHQLLPQARRVMGLLKTDEASIDTRWKELLQRAFADPALRDDMVSARDRAIQRVQAALKGLGTPQKDATEDEDCAEAKSASAATHVHTSWEHHARTGLSIRTSDNLQQEYGKVDQCHCSR